MRRGEGTVEDRSIIKLIKEYNYYIFKSVLVVTKILSYSR